MELLPPKVPEEWGTTVWARFSCSRCGAQPNQWCRRWPYWHWVLLFYLDDRFHKERITKAMLVCDGDPMAPYGSKGCKTDAD